MNVLMSIKPMWIELIASGKKTLEIRKSMPKNVKYPFKVYMYCTKGIKSRPFDNPWSSKYINFSPAGYNKGSWYDIEGTIVGEFTVNHITRFSAHEEPLHFVDGIVRGGYTICDDISSKYFGSTGYVILRDSCLTGKQMVDYIGDNKIGFAWEISDVVIYDKPKYLSDFYKTCTKKDCDGCEFLHFPLEDWETPYCDTKERRQITRPPQSWCFVEEGIY